MPPHRSADRHPAGPGLHLGRLGAICGSMPWRQQRSQSGHDPHRWNPRPVWAGAKVSQTLRRRRRAILSRPTARDARDLCSERLESSCHCGHANASDRQTYFCECTDKQTMSRRSSVLEMWFFFSSNKLCSESIFRSSEVWHENEMSCVVSCFHPSVLTVNWCKLLVQKAELNDTDMKANHSKQRRHERPVKFTWCVNFLSGLWHYYFQLIVQLR